MEAITSLHPSLRALLETAQTICTGRPTDSIRLAQSGQVDFSMMLFDGDNSPLQNLLRDCADKRSPEDLKDDILRARATHMRKFLYPIEPRFRDVVVNMPILLAIAATTDSVEESWGKQASYVS